MATLKDVRVGESCTVAALTGTGALKRRIMDMGLTKGTSVYVRKVAPLGDPIELTVRGYELSIRKDEAANVEVRDVTAGEVVA
ncbi:FeoA family protein [Thermophilibacter immobilis]|jgi:ferrous iron transport protein A|uniref:Ferrous iron transport protein A n=1 Tax=Thermophilibacter immobilis TaxID=2779519 RepID=A0A7S7M9I0_9ACTN|nr:ferrous iron transport protein A [Thermophilibacter immobilis]QOY61190.1 ferrous iron transport protein A [Thermophilibacter immobilis]